MSQHEAQREPQRILRDPRIPGREVEKLGLVKLKEKELERKVRNGKARKSESE